MKKKKKKMKKTYFGNLLKKKKKKKERTYFIKIFGKLNYFISIKFLLHINRLN